MNGAAREGRVSLTVRLTPRAGADRVDGVVDGVLRVRVAAPPVDGEANEALTRLLAGELRVAPSAVRVIRGATGRTKVVEVSGVERSVVALRWPGLGV